MTKIDRRAHMIAVLLAMVLYLSGGFAATGATKPALTATEVDEIVAEIKAVYESAQVELEELPKDRFERLWVVEQSNFEVERIIGWVEQNTCWVPYQGVLRGAAGVLLDRQGNSLDRSLLLAGLLEDAGFDVRLARGQLSESAVERMLRESNGGSYEVASLESYASEEARRVVGRASEQAAVLAEMVELPDTPWSAEVKSAAADLWWVEAKLESGWQTFDPQLGGPLTSLRPEAVQRLAPDELPAELFHQVTVRVVIERWDRGKVSEEIPLQHSLRAVDGTYHDLGLQFEPFGY